MYFELQLSAGVFTHIVRSRLKSIPLCVDRETLDSDGTTALVVDRVVIGDTTWIQREQALDLVNGLPSPRDSATQVVWTFSPKSYGSSTVPFLQVKQEVVIHLVKATDLEANGGEPTPPYRSFTIFPVFNVKLSAAKQTQGGGPLTLSYTLAYIDFAVLFLALSKAQRDDIEKAVAGIQLPATTLDLGPLTAMLRRPVSAINAGIVCDPSGAFVALRVDFDVYASEVAVDPHFFRAPPENLLGGRQWAMLVDKDVLIADATARAKKALQSASKVRLNGGPHVGWDPAGPALAIDADAELVDACPFFVDDIDMDVDIEIRTSFSVPAPNTFRTHFRITGEPSDLGEEIACAVTAALLWPFIGPVLLKDEDLGEGLGAYLGGLAGGPAVVFVGLIAAIETKKLSKDISKDLGGTCKKLDDENYECNDVLALNMALVPGANSRLELDDVRGVARGLVLGGRISNLREFDVGRVEAVRVCPFAWQVLGRCTGNGKSNFRIGNQAQIGVFATPPAGLCFARILEDPAQEFTLTRAEGTVTIVPAFTPGYRAAPYPCRVRVVTNRGVRTVTLPAPVPLGSAQADALERERLAARLPCYFWEKRFLPVEKVKWLPDPPFDRGLRVLHFWQLAVHGMRSDESIRVEHPGGGTLMTAFPSRAGVAHFSLLLAGEDAPGDLSLELRRERRPGAETREPGSGEPESAARRAPAREDRPGDEREDAEAAVSDDAREMTVQQIAYVHRASIPVAGPRRALRFEGGARRRHLVVEDADGEATWDVSAAAAPALVRSTTLDAYEHEGDHEDRHGHDRARTDDRARDQERPGEGPLVVHDGKRVGRAPTPTLRRALERLGDRGGRPQVVGSPRVGGVEETLYVRSKRGATLFDISGADEPRELHAYEAPAWFEGVAVAGTVLARHELAVSEIWIYVAALRPSCG